MTCGCDFLISEFRFSTSSEHFGFGSVPSNLKIKLRLSYTFNQKKQNQSPLHAWDPFHYEG